MSLVEVVTVFFKHVIVPLVAWYVTLEDFVTTVRSRAQGILGSIFAPLKRFKSDGCEVVFNAIKRELFSELLTLKSFNDKLRTKGRIRLLELGVGSGVNFQFYPQKVSLIAVEPNPDFRRDFYRNLANFPGIDLEGLVMGDGDHLCMVKDGSVDAVIATTALCKVNDEVKVLREIKRVLATGGQYFFMEHVIGEKRSFLRSLQFFMAPLWANFFDGCRLTRDFAKAIQQAGFSRTTIGRFVAPLRFHKSVFAPHIFGKARK